MMSWVEKGKSNVECNLFKGSFEIGFDGIMHRGLLGHLSLIGCHLSEFKASSQVIFLSIDIRDICKPISSVAFYD